ncbi:hypothetical protein QQX98_000488 [Neonectria punicea]|uniref:Transcription factor domain-containing protein n=1 Tax=Neonectria punicea TaxID=979145 RepID=A0ABR1HTG0_9HYPO
MERVADERRRRQRRRQRRSKTQRRDDGILLSSTAGNDSHSQRNSLLRALEPLAWLRRSERALLHHFVSEASCVAISSRHGQRLFCNTILPLALQSPPLLYATLAYSAVQQASLHTVEATDLHRSVSRYVGMSLAAFQAELPQAGSSSQASLLAASLMLCLVSMSSGDIHSGSWRVHAEGAKALLASIHRSDNASASADIDAIDKFLSRWYLNVESLASMTSAGLVTGQCVVQDSTWGTITEPDQFALDVCDDHFGYPARLAMLFREIGASAWERRRQLSLWPSLTEETAGFTVLTQQDFHLDADTLQASLDTISADTLHSSRGLAFYPGVREELSDTDVRGFVACTEAYIHMARILVERRVRGASSRSEMVQASARAIMRAVSSIPPSHEPSPAMAIGPPLFTAGCEALELVDRQAVRNIFHDHYSEVRSKNMERALSILETLWANGIGVVLDWIAYQEA